MTDQSPTREELIERLETLRAAARRPKDPTGWKVHDSHLLHWLGEHMGPEQIAYLRALFELPSLLRSDSQRIAELEGRLKSMASSAEIAAAGAVARLLKEIGSSLEPLAALAAEFAKPQFMTASSGPGARPNTRKYSLEFTFLDEGESREGQAQWAALHDAIRIAAKAVNS